MNIDNIKSFLGVAGLDFNQLEDKDGVASVWYIAWTSSPKRAIIVHEDLVSKISTSQKLSLKDKGFSISKKGEEYRTYVIVEYEKVAFSV